MCKNIYKRQTSEHLDITSDENIILRCYIFVALVEVVRHGISISYNRQRKIKYNG